VPLSPITAGVPVEELLAMVMLPVAAPTALGLNSKLSVAVSFGVKVIGKAPADIAKPAPVNVAALIITGAVPVDFKITDCVARVFTSTLPNATLDASMLRVRVPGVNCNGAVFEMPPALASSITVCGDPTDEMTAMNPAPLAFAGTEIVAGSVTAELLLDNSTVRAPTAGASSVTEQGTEPDPVIDALLQDSALTAGGLCSLKV